MKTGVLMAVVLIAAGAARCAGAPESVALDPEVLKVREAAWRAYFAGDVDALRAMLPEEFIGIGMEESPFATLPMTLEGARDFREGGGRLVRLEFPETQAQRYGDVVVLYGRYEVVLESGGVERTLRGRLTEVFVRTDGTWRHPGWHLDLTSGPTS